MFEKEISNTFEDFIFGSEKFVPFYIVDIINTSKGHWLHSE